MKKSHLIQRPEHSVFNVVALNNDTLTGIFAEVSWTMPFLSGASMMTHSARRALYKVVESVPLMDVGDNDLYDAGGKQNLYRPNTESSEYISLSP